jgi:O-antigen/teichoic acid export membrane protein
MGGPARRSTLSRLLTNGAWNALATVVSGGIAFLLVPLLLRRLGPETYGVWVLIGSLFAYASILHFGLSSAINWRVPIALVNGDNDAIRRVLTTGSAFFVAMGAVVLVATALLRRYFVDWFNVPLQLGPEAERAVLVVGCLLGVTVALQAFGAALSGYQRYDLSAISRIVFLLVRGAVLWVLLRADAGLLAVAWTFGLTELGVNGLQVLLGRRLLPARPLAVRWFDPSLLRGMLAYGGNTFLYSAGAVIAYKASEVVLGVLRRPEDVARYAVAATGVLTISAIVESLSAAIKPAVSDLDARDESELIHRLAFAAQKLALLVILPSTAFLVFLGGDFLRLWTRTDLGEVHTAMALLAVGQAFKLAQQSNFLVLVGKGEHRFFGLAVVGAGAITIALTLLAVGPLDLGVIGAAGSSCLAWVTIAGVVIPAHVNKQFGVSRRERWRRVFCPALLGSAPGIALLGVWSALRQLGSWVEMGILVGAVALVTSVVAWRLSLDPAERARVVGAVRTLSGRGN